MTLEVIRGTTDKPIAAEALVSALRSDESAEGELILGFPNLATQPGDAIADAIWLSPDYGAVLFDLVEGSDLDGFEDRQADIYRLFSGRLLQNKSLVRRRSLLVDPLVVTFAPALNSAFLPESGEDEIVANRATLIDELAARDLETLDNEVYLKLLSAAQGISKIRHARQKRTPEKEGSRGDKLRHLEDSISTLDRLQHRAVIETVEGVQRIRGLAGSGKTVILALKVAYLHARNPDWEIAVTFYTRSLKDQLRRLIIAFCVEQSGIEPDWDKIHVVNAWGGRGGRDNSGIYKEYCDANGLEYHDFRSAKNAFGNDSAFEGAVLSAIEQTTDPVPRYDVILVDEAQDFPPAFLRMCYQLLREPRRLVYAYDELQSLSGEGLPEPDEIFGLDETGAPRVSFGNQGYSDGSRQDIVLEKCYRNSRPVLVTAHSLGFGVYRRPRRRGELGLVQMFDQDHLWHDIGYRSDSDITPGRDVRLYRTQDSSPKFLEEHSAIDDLIQFRVFSTVQEQNEWVAAELEANLVEDELRYDDLMVINPNPFTSRKNLGPIRSTLLERGIKNHLAGVDLSPNIFFAPEQNSVTFTGINRAKGNEAAMVYVVNAQDGNEDRINLATIRNRLFTAITRSKAWVRVCGVGEEMEPLVAEFRELQAKRFELQFEYPSSKDREHLRIVHREVSGRERSKLRTSERSLLDLLDGLKSGEVYREDLDPDILAELERVFRGGGGE